MSHNALNQFGLFIDALIWVHILLRGTPISKSPQHGAVATALCSSKLAFTLQIASVQRLNWSFCPICLRRRGRHDPPVWYHGHLWPYYPVTCDPILPAHLRPYYLVTCDPIPLITLTPPCVPPYNGLHSTSLFELPPCVPLNHGLYSASLFELPPPAFH